MILHSSALVYMKNSDNNKQPVMENRKSNRTRHPKIAKMNEVIFEADTPAGKAFDVILLVLIVLSVIAVLLDSMESIHQQYGTLLNRAEWIYTVIFTVEYFLRIISSRSKTGYIFSFYGIIDLLAILPSYMSLILTGTQFFVVIRILRLLRVFRVLKLARYLSASRTLSYALRESRHKIVVFLEVVITLVVIMGSLMYLIEGPSNGFTSIPKSIYWAIVTLTTVGYGDIAPQTFLGQTLASVIMIIGYAIIAIPTGIISVELARADSYRTVNCPNCGTKGMEPDSRYCSNCGEMLRNPETREEP